MRCPEVAFVGDDPLYQGELAAYLEAHGFVVRLFTSVGEFLNRPASTAASILLIDIRGQLGHAAALLQRLSEFHQFPLLVLSDSADEAARIACLEQGADDVILKSTRPREIVARLRAAARHVSADVSQRGTQPPAPGEWRFLPDTRELIAPNRQRIELTTAEFHLLEILVSNSGRPLDRDRISRAVLGRPFNAIDRSIDNLVARLRRKLGDSARSPRIIKTARSTGYVFTGFPRAAASENPETGDSNSID